MLKDILRYKNVKKNTHLMKNHENAGATQKWSAEKRTET